ncbi:hypothetical protein BKA65DRAFT_535825 [Rhexocercosporidium sp. MPI-PUGE-AT-0058]|nr:hypothetical protein BKA65DRAFT_535825 [Rhexocercosporidium sp. MPI-PUGE-AT-0058]
MDNMDNMASQQGECQEQAQQLQERQQHNPQELPPSINDNGISIPVVEPFAFHYGRLPLSTASRLSAIYLSRLPTPNNTLPTAHAAITRTILSASSALLKYLILGVLFPLLRAWSSNPNFLALMTNLNRVQRLAVWREKAITIPEVMARFLEVFDTMLDRRWVYAVEDGVDPVARALRSKMQAYLLWKFVLTADVVFVELVMRLSYEPYNRERFHEWYYPAMLPRLMSINSDPNIIPFLAEPAHWPSNTRVDEGTLHRCLALIDSNLD